MAEKATVLDAMRRTMADRHLAGPETAALLMVSGGSDSTALAYLAAELREAGDLGALAMLHVNHQLRGRDADEDARFVAQLAALLGIPLFSCEIDVAGEAKRTGGNVEAVARQERYLAANEALRSLCLHEAFPLAEGRIVTAHTADDRIESFYMRSIVGTGPGGFRSMRYANGPVVRPLLDATRAGLRAHLEARAADGLPVVRDGQGALWREDATNAHTDRFRAYVRHEVVPAAKEWNPSLPEVLTRTMNLIADEDDMVEAMALDLVLANVTPWEGDGAAEAAGEGSGIDEERNAPQPLAADYVGGFRLEPGFGHAPVPLQRRAVRWLLQAMLGADERIDAAAVDGVLAAFAADGAPIGGYVTNIQGDLAVSANKQGVRVEPMARFRARRKRDRM